MDRDGGDRRVGRTQRLWRIGGATRRGGCDRGDSVEFIAVSTLAGLPKPAGGAAPASQINMGMVQGAVYDAVNAITPKHHRPYLLNETVRQHGVG